MSQTSEQTRGALQQAGQNRFRHLTDADLKTPAFVYDEGALRTNAIRLAWLCQEAGCSLLYALKPLSMVPVLKVLRQNVAGFSASSLYEAMAARKVIGRQGSVHITTPGLRPNEIDRVAATCDYITFNSLPQWEALGHRAVQDAKCGLRVNPHLSLVEDDRYNPCRRHSKLGVHIGALCAEASSRPEILSSLTGLHFHTNCDCADTRPLLNTVNHIATQLPHILDKLEWINLGGGYLLPVRADLGPFNEAVNLLTDKWGVQVFFEPGAAVVRQACCLVASVIDIFDSDGWPVAVLDTSVNHMPEVFEYQFTPDVYGTTAGGSHAYLLAGSTCLAGDVFGRHAFRKPLEIGSRVVFPGMGAYTSVKWHCFNGVSLPDVYAWTEQDELVHKHTFTYADYTARYGGPPDATS